MSFADATPRLSTISKGGSVQNISAVRLPNACFGKVPSLERNRTIDVPMSATTTTNIASEISSTTRKMLQIAAALGDTGSRTGTSDDASIAPNPGEVRVLLRIMLRPNYPLRQNREETILL
jgi:hypothetical protein